MSTLSERILAAISSAKLSYSELSEITKIPKAALQRYATGTTPKIPLDRIELIAKATNVSPQYLMGWNESPDYLIECPDDENPYELELREAFSKYDVDAQRIIASNLSSLARFRIRPIVKKKIPMLGNVACGDPIFASEEYDAYIEVDSDISADFCLKAKGDSMINARIFDGDILFVKKQDIVNDGEIAVVLIEDEATVKRIYYDKENNILTLIPENPMHKPMRFEGEKLNQIRILGKVVFGQYRME